MYALVTGAGGFLGRYIVEALVARGDRVRGFARGEYPELAQLGVEMVRGDLADREAVAAACREVDCVFHVASRVGIWGPWREYYAANVVGTQNVIAGCRAAGVQRLVFTSSPSVTFDGRDQCGVDESAPYPTRWLARYPHSKALAEQAVLGANGVEGLRTCALRPHLVWGPRDHHLTARLIERARSGRLWRVGDGANLVDIAYVENVAEAHLRVADALGADSPPAEAGSPGGRVYFLSQGEPVNCWAWIDEILALVDLPPVRKSISASKAYGAGAMCEAAWSIARLRSEPPMTRFLARQLATSHWFDIGAARRDFGYEPRVSTAEGMRHVKQWLQSSFTPDMERRRKIANSSDELMLMMIEPWGEDYWLRPGETVELRAPVTSLQCDFQISNEREGISVWAPTGMIEISVYSGNEPLKLGYQRPPDWPR